MNSRALFSLSVSAPTVDSELQVKGKVVKSLCKALASESCILDA